MAGANIKIAASSSQFQKEMKEVTRQLKLVSSECGVASTKAKLFGTTQDQLAVKYKELTAKLNAQNTMLKLHQDRVKGITSDIEKEKQKREELGKKLDEAKKKYEEVSKATGKDSEESKKLKAEKDKLQLAYEKTATNIEDYNKNLDDSIIRMNNTEKNILKNQKALEDLNKEISNCKIDKLADDFDKVSEVTGKASDKLKPVSTAITGIGTASVVASITFEDSMAKVSTIADETQVSYDEMKKSIIDLSNQTGISANEIADNVYNAISAGQETGDSVNFVTNSTKLAKAGFAEAGQSLDILTTILNAYGLEAKEVTNVSDVLVQVQNKGKTTVAELASSMGKIIPTANSVSVNLEQLGTGYALMTSKGIATAETTTYMNSMLNELSDSGSKVAGILKKQTGQSFSELMQSGVTLGDAMAILEKEAEKTGLAMSELWSSSEAGKAALVLATDSGKAFNSTLKEMKNSVGATDEAFNKVNNTTGNEFKKSINEIKNSAINLGDTLAPVTSMIASGFSKVSKVLSGLSSDQLKVISGIGGGIVAINLVLGSVSKLTKGISDTVKAYKSMKEFGSKAIEMMNVFKGAQAALNFVMALNPITLVIVGLIALAAVFVVLYNKCEWFRNGVNNVWEKITNIFFTFDNFLKGVFATDWTESFGVFGNVINAFFKNMSNIWESIKRIFTGIIDFVAGVFTGDWSRSWEGVKNIFGGIMDGLGAVIKAPLNAVIGLINMAIGQINKISFTAPDWIPFVGGKHFGVNLPKINYLYEGGIITSPTFINPTTVVGDAYKGRGRQAEAVIPLDKMYKKIKEIVNNEVGEREIILYTTNTFIVDGQELEKKTVKKVLKTINKSTKNYKKKKGENAYA
ncbi:phage tail tape measure protein [Clostridium cuniculi]|uniref:phage tail tape measure protein n=1 Tax=Clostridium cuniculi TaxID=2548455 RepID=UPI001055CB9A|nr:phage tail tape measure protein [Clostridium cuniculi]